MTNSSKDFKTEVCLTRENVYLRDMVVMCALGILMCNMYNIFLEKICNAIFSSV